ncbi:hypothetical protein BC628DRAFT_1418706 [Trametes gibbosa]|nr:hypothetical protein BC628DRAFT_1418706 [Trametes gibbosa]
MVKRAREGCESPSSSSPAKRRHVSESVPASSPSTAHSTPYALPYFRSPYSDAIPHDSPSNPFGLNRTLRALTLPRPTGFGKHIVLRMQLVSTTEPTPDLSIRSRRPPLPDAPFRVAQVPLNYSFRHLHMLLLFLFASDARLHVRRRKHVANHTLRARTQPVASRKPRLLSKPILEGPPEGDGHLFEVFEDIRLYNPTYRPGVIKAGTGKLYARLSSTRERKLFPDDPPSKLKDDDVFRSARGESATGPDGAGNEEDSGWDWEAEDDFPLYNVWMDGPTLKKGIIYHHTPSTAIHITINHTRFPTRKGVGNAPFVFSARGGTQGAVRIANVARYPVSPPPSISASAPKRKPKPQPDRRDNGKGKSAQLATPSGSSDSHHSDWDSSSGTDADAPPPPQPHADGDDGDEVPELAPREDADEPALERWNAHGAFERFLRREAARERAMRRPPQPPSTASGHGGSRTGGASALPPVRAVRTGRAARAVEGDLPGSSPLAPRSAYRYGHRKYACAEPGARPLGQDEGEDGDEHDDDEDGAAAAAALRPPSSPSTLPIEIPSDCDALWTDTDGERGRAGSASALSSSSSSSSSDGRTRRTESARARENMRYMIELPLLTPFPAHPSLRRRVRRVEERMERCVSKGLKAMDVDEEGVGKGKGKAVVAGEGAAPGEKSGQGKEKDKVGAGGKGAGVVRKDNAAAAPSAAPAALAPSRGPGPIKPDPRRVYDYNRERDRGSPVKAELKRTAHAPLPPPPPPPPPARSVRPVRPVRPPTATAPAPPALQAQTGSGSGSQESDGSEGTVESVEVGGYSGGAPWLRMKGPRSDGSGWASSEEEV